MALAYTTFFAFAWQSGSRLPYFFMMLLLSVCIALAATLDHYHIGLVAVIFAVAAFYFSVFGLVFMFQLKDAFLVWRTPEIQVE